MSRAATHEAIDALVAVRPVPAVRPIPAVRVSSAHARGRWGAVRYQVTLRADGAPTLRARECASSDRRSVRLASRDADEIAEREDRIAVDGRPGHPSDGDLARAQDYAARHGDAATARYLEAYQLARSAGCPVAVAVALARRAADESLGPDLIAAATALVASGQIAAALEVVET